MNLILKEKQEELNRLRRIIKELEDELETRNGEYKQERERSFEMIASIDKFEKNLIKEMNEEQRKLASIGLIPKLVKYSRYSFKVLFRGEIIIYLNIFLLFLSSNSFRNNQNNAACLETFQTAFVSQIELFWTYFLKL